MRWQGRLHAWNDERGFGFVEPNGGGDKAFVHIRAFRPRLRRPVDGDLITYRAERDAQGRWQAMDVDFARQRSRVEEAAKAATPRTARWAWLGAAYTAILVASSGAGLLPWAASSAVAGLSLIAFVAYWNDKRAAMGGRWRTPESHLHLIAMLGGWPGAAFAQHALRHKSRKPGFRAMFITTVVLNIVGTVFLASEKGQALLASLAGT